MSRSLSNRKAVETNSLAESVLFLGGSPCSGKSSAASALCQRYGLRYYSLKRLDILRALPIPLKHTTHVAEVFF